MNIFTVSPHRISGGLLLVCAVLWHVPVDARAYIEVTACEVSASNVYKACKYESKEDYLIAEANCLHLVDGDEQEECLEEALEEKRKSRKLCGRQYRARNALCLALGEDQYDPSDFWAPDNFVDPAEIGGLEAANPYFSLIPGGVSVLENEDEVITVTVTDKTKLIEGVTCLVVNDLVTEDNQAVEDTDDWYAQDIYGNVWYCGEISKNYELFEGDDPEEAELVDVEGSWKAFRDGAKPGIQMKAWPQVGDIYRQEMLLGDAEDIAEVIAINVGGMLAGDECEDDADDIAELIDELCDGDCLVTNEFTPVEPGVAEHKYYAWNVGLILEIDDEGACTTIVTDDDDGDDDSDDEDDDDDDDDDEEDDD